MTMKAGQNIQLVQLATTRKQWREFFLLIGGTSLILIGLSVGLALSTWRLLFQGLRQFTILWTQQGVGGLGLLLLLVGQLLFSLAAWALLIRVAMREVVRLRNLPSETEKQMFTPPATAHVAGVSAFYQPTPTAIVPAPAVQGAPVPLPPGVTTTPGRPVLPGVQVTLIPSQSNIDKAGASTRSSLSEQRTIASAPPTQASQGATPEQIRPKPQIASAPEVPLPRSVSLSPDVPSGFPLQTQQASPPTQKKTQQKHDIGEALEDPFAVNQDIVKAFLQENPLAQEKGQAQQKRVSSEPIQEFIFGNPFEGLLPDVFEHDEDLKRSVQERHLTMHPRSTPGNEPTR